MIIEIESFHGVTPNFRGGGHPSNLKIDVHFAHGQAETLFYQLWEYVGDEDFVKWLAAEGYELVKKQKEDS